MSAFPLIPEEMRKQYIERRKVDALNLEKALESRDAAPFERIGHQIKGNAVTFGFKDLEAIGARLEELGRTADFGKATEELGSFRNWITTQEKALN